MYFLSNFSTYMYIPSTFLDFDKVRMLEECSSRLVFKAIALYAAAYLYLYRTFLSHKFYM